MHANSLSMLVQMVRNGMGVTLLPAARVPVEPASRRGFASVASVRRSPRVPRCGVARGHRPRGGTVHVSVRPRSDQPARQHRRRHAIPLTRAEVPVRANTHGILLSNVETIPGRSNPRALRAWSAAAPCARRTSARTSSPDCATCRRRIAGVHRTAPRGAATGRRADVRSRGAARCQRRGERALRDELGRVGRRRTLRLRHRGQGGLRWRARTPRPARRRRPAHPDRAAQRKLDRATPLPLDRAAGSGVATHPGEHAARAPRAIEHDPPGRASSTGAS